jgi:pyruvate,water dikinase
MHPSPRLATPAAAPAGASSTAVGPAVFPLSAPEAGELARAGGKAVGLHALVTLGLPVPPGFCVSADAFRAALAEGGLAPLLAACDALGRGADGGAVRALAARVREAVGALPLPAALEAALLAHWREGLQGAPVAVRSSATAEDLADASFAGQQDTVLGVRGPAALLAAVRQCWASLFSERALAYRLHHGVPSATAAMGVVVQRLVEADVAGVLFTADPASGHRGVATVEAVAGLGEALVAGHALPDRFRVRKADGHLLEARAATPGAPLLLSPAALAALVALGREVEARRGAPQDLEWALEGGRPWLLQARPITTLHPPVQPPDTDGHWHVYASFGHLQVNTAWMSPLARSVFRRLVPLARTLPGEGGAAGESRVLKELGGRLYVDLTPVLASPVLGPRFVRAIASMSPQLAERAAAARARPELAASARALALSPRALLPVLGGVPPRALLAALLPTRGVARRYVARLDAFVREGAARVATAGEGPASRLAALHAELGGAFGVLMFRNVAPLLPLFFAGASLLRRWTRRWAPGEAEDALLRGLEGNVVTEMDLRLGDLADLAREVPALRDALASASPAEGVAALRGRPEAAAFFAAFDAFLAAHGQRVAGELDVAVPRWREAPGAPLRSVASLLPGERGAHRARQTHARAEAERVLAVVLAGARRGPLGGLRAAWVRRTVARVRTLLALREHHKEALTHLLWQVRVEALAAGALLARADALARAEDAFLLTLPELRAACAALEAGGALSPLRERVAAREAERARLSRWAPPAMLTSDGEALAPEAPAHAAPPGTHVGTGVSSGVVEARVRVVEDPARESLQQGEVLVAAFTDPGWTPLFLHAAGLVMEVGGTMTHGSVVARELGIPAVVAVEGATRLLRTGMRVRVDGERGWVTVLEEAGREGAGREGAGREGEGGP